MRVFEQFTLSVVSRLASVAAILAVLAIPAAARAQTAQTRGKLVVTVADPSGAVVPSAVVTLAGQEEATKAVSLPPVTAGTNGAATFENIVPGRYTIGASFPGFEIGLLRDVRVNRGDNKHVVVLPLKNMSESVTVAREGQSAAANRGSNAFGLNVTQEQIQALSDDPAELQRQLSELAGPDAIFRVDSFEGQQLPPKSQIKSIHITRDQFAAETEQPGSTFVDVITQPGIGPIRGNANMSFRDGSMSARNQFLSSKGPEQTRIFGATIGGALIDQKSNFSLSVNGQSQYTTPNLNVVTPTGARYDVLGVRQPIDQVNINALFDYALTRDQTLRFGYQEQHQVRKNIGMGFYDLQERGFKQDQNGYTFRAMEAGPIGRRMFINSRITLTRRNFGATSNTEAPTIIVQDAFTSGGAQQAGRVYNKSFIGESDVDYVRGINSWRGGVKIYGDWYEATLNNNYLGTYTFSDLASFEAGKPILYTRSIGDPHLSFFHARVGWYFQDDVRVKKGLTLSPGVRYSYQTHVNDNLAFEPRLGVTWAPTKSGTTTLRASGGIFHGWLDPGIWWQTVRFDPTHQRELIIRNPTYPDPGTGSIVTSPNTYRLGEYKLNKNLRYSAGIDQRFSPRFSVNVLYNYYHQDQLPRGQNLNPIVNGLRVDPNYANIIQTVTDAEIIRHELYVNYTFSLAAPSPALQRATFNWRRLQVNGNYAFVRAHRNALGPFDVPASGSLDTEWGNGPADNPYRINVGVTSTQIKNLSANIAFNASDGNVFMEQTGFDNNADGLLNDRPLGVGIWTLRTTPQRTLSARLTYALPMGAPAQPGGAPQRYRASLFVSINNITNHANYIGFSGVVTSPNFLKATNVANPRKVDVGLNISF